MENMTRENTSLPVHDDKLPVTAIFSYNLFLYMIILIGVFGNILVLCVFRWIKSPTSTDWFITFITISDFVSSVANVPVYATFSNGVWKQYGTNMLCKVHMFVSQSVVVSSTFFICGIALGRYMKICKPGRGGMTNKTTRNVCVVICISAFVLSTPCFVIFQDIQHRCIAQFGFGLLAYYTFVFLTFISAFVIVVFSYVSISLAVKRTQRNVMRHCSSRERRPGIDIGWSRSVFPNNRIQPTAIDSATQHNNDGIDEHNDACIIKSTDATIGEYKANKKRMLKSEHDDVLGNVMESDKIVNAGRQSSSVFCVSVTPNNEKQSSNKQHVTRSTRTTQISFLVCSIFIVSWIPPWLSFFIMAIPGDRSAEVVTFVMFGKMTYLLNTVTNPFVYAWLNMKFRERVAHILCFWNRR